MTTGTILVVGPMEREAELFIKRLEQESYQVASLNSIGSIRRWLKNGVAQAVVVTDACSQSFVEQVMNLVRNTKRCRHVPVIMVTDTEPPVRFQKIKGIGEFLRLHTIPLNVAVHRLRLAVQLTELSRQLNKP